MKPIRVLLADDHALVRAGIRALLERSNDIEVTAEAGDGVEALELARIHRPDLILLDITLPRLSGLEVLATLAAELPEIKTIVLTIHDSAEYAISTLRAGARGYLPKKAASDELVEAIRAVLRGETYLSPEIAKDPTADYKASLTEKGLTDELTPRQIDVLKMIAEGYSTKEIAQALNISVKTVETHRASLMERLNIHDVAGLVRYSIKHGLTKIEG